MICLNCGRPNPSGTSLCNRCRERRPGLERARSGVIYQRTRETARVGSRGPGLLVVGVLLLAGLIFAGGTLAVFLGPKGPAATDAGIAFLPDPSASRLDIFEQQTATPVPTPEGTPWFPSPSPLFTDLLSPTPVVEFTLPPSSPGAVTPGPTRTPKPTKTPTAAPDSTPTATATTDTQPQAKFNGSQQGSSTSAQFNNNSVRAVSWQWNFHDQGSSDLENPGSFDFGSYGNKTVTLTVTDADGDQDTIQKTINLEAPDCDETGNPPGCNPTPQPSVEPPPTEVPTQTPLVIPPAFTD